MTGECELTVWRRKSSNVFSLESLPSWLSFYRNCSMLIANTRSALQEGRLHMNDNLHLGIGCPFGFLQNLEQHEAKLQFVYSG